MSGREKTIALVVYLTLIVAVQGATIAAFLAETIDFDRFIAQSIIIIGLVGSLLIKLPAGKDENVDVQAKTVTVSEEAVEPPGPKKREDE